MTHADAVGQDTNRLGRHLDAVIAWAGRLGDLQDVWKPAEQRLHLRVSSKGIRLVDVDPLRPQLDRGVVRRPDHVVSDFEQRLGQAYSQAPGRSTPEKAFQSWLILEAYRNGRQMKALGPGLEFVTDELVVYGAKKNVCDVLALRRVDGREVPVLIELKSSRDMKRLVEQLDVACLVDAETGRFEQLYSAILGREVRFGGLCERWLIWPMLAGREDEPRAAELAEKRILAIGYRPLGEGFDIRLP